MRTWSDGCSLPSFRCGDPQRIKSPGWSVTVCFHRQKRIARNQSEISTFNLPRSQRSCNVHIGGIANPLAIFSGGRAMEMMLDEEKTAIVRKDEEEKGEEY